MSLVTGQTFSHEFTVSEEIHTAFIETFKDKNPLHVDDKFAGEKGFNGRVMHGNILNGFISFFIGECLPIKNVIIHSQQIQYNKAVYLNDSLLLAAEVSDVFESVNVVEFKFHFTNSDSVKVAKGKISIGVI